LADGLLHSGLDVWCDTISGALTAGTSWVQGLQESLEDSSGYLLLVGKGPVSGWVQAELEYALNRQARQPSFRLVPVLMPGVSPETLPPLVARFQAIFLEKEPRQLDAAGFLHLKTTLASQTTALSSPEEPETCPFPGLDAFTENLSRFFFGRDQEIRKAVGGLGTTPAGYRRWLQIEGASGVGKSSLARAGVLPAVRRGWIDGRRGEWRTVTLRPGQEPLRRLARSLSRELFEPDVDPGAHVIETRLRADPKALLDFLEQHLPENESLLLLIDQFEELVTLSGAAIDVPILDRLLATAIDTGDSRFHLVTTVRSDLLSMFSRLPCLERLLNEESRYHLQRIDKEGLEQAISLPAQLAHLQWQTRDLPQRIANDSLEAPGGLPLLGHTLRTLWNRRDGKVLSADLYTELGGVGGALAKNAGSLMSSLAAHREEGLRNDERAWELLLSLVQIDHGKLFRQVVSRSDALAAAGGGAAAERVLLRLSGARDPNAPANAPSPVRLVIVRDDQRVELVHEELLRSWKEFQRKALTNADRLERRKSLEVAAQAWFAAGRPRRELPGAKMLAYYRKAGPCNAISKEFLQRGERRRNGQRALAAAFALLVVALITFFAFVRWTRLQNDLFDARVLQRIAELENLRGEADIPLPGEPENIAQFKNWLERRDVLVALPRKQPESWREWLDPLTFRRIRPEQTENMNRLSHLEEDVLSPNLKTEVEARYLLARENEQRVKSVPQVVWARKWSDLATSLRNGETALAPGAQVPPRRELLPLRINPQGLWELVDLRSGEPPEIDTTSGRLKMTGASGIVFVLLPGGEFWMGAQSTDLAGRHHDPQAESDEGPVHKVAITPYYLSKFETTRGQWYRLTGLRTRDINDYDDSHPVGLLSWDEISRTLQKLDLVLPTEEQWEYAARAGTKTRFWSGDEDSKLNQAGWHLGNVKGGKILQPINLKDPNPFGLHDVNGNVWEWCSSSYQLYQSNRKFPEIFRIMRGGSYMTGPKLARSATRNWFHSGNRSINVGFRAARSLS
jgi:formylglycine-generating enzyme required for sulfatase activity